VFREGGTVFAIAAMLDVGTSLTPGKVFDAFRVLP
jgi:hypothetical protein